MKIFLFDVDNTLTPARQKILKEHKSLLKQFIKQNNVYLISGSDLEKIKWQVGSTLLRSVKGTFSCLGNAHHNKQLKEIYSNTFPQLESLDLLKDINSFLEISKTPYKTGNHIEKRIGMLNVSTIGRNCTLEQRKEYHLFDSVANERQSFVLYLKNRYSELDVSVGGEISIDIAVKDYNKSQVIDFLNKKFNNKQIQYIFFGDRCDPQGNDYPLASKVAENNGKVYIIKDYNETYEILKSLI